MNGTTQPGGFNRENKSQQGLGGAPPGSEINVRTTASDIKSIFKGDAMPVPESVLPPQADKEPVFKPETQLAEGTSPVFEQEKPKKKKALVWVLVGVAVIAVFVIGYFAYPLVFPTSPVEAPPVQPPAGPQPPAILTHQSLFKTPAAKSAEIRLGNLLYSTIVSYFTSLVAANKQIFPAGTLQEVAVLDGSGSQIPFKSYASVFMPVFGTDELGSWFEDDFTAFIFYSQSGSWPGYVAQVKNGVNLDEVRASFAQVEGTDVSKFFLLPPGNASAFKTGQVGGASARYQSFSQSGAAFSYTFLDSYLILSTNYEGAQKAASLLGY